MLTNQNELISFLRLIQSFMFYNMKILTWNINGIRATKVPLKELFDRLDADVICFQETKVTSECNLRVVLTLPLAKLLSDNTSSSSSSDTVQGSV